MKKSPPAPPESPADAMFRRTSGTMSSYSDRWIEEEEAAIQRGMQPVRRALPSPPLERKPFLTEKQQDVIMETLFGQAAPQVQAGLGVAGSVLQSESGQKAVVLGGLAIGAGLLPAATRVLGKGDGPARSSMLQVLTRRS